MPSLTNEAVDIAIDPERGGKITSLRDRRSGRQWLLTPAKQSGPPAGYGRAFVEEELSGWDEMLPTILACEIPGEQGAVALPDHGEVWSVPWKITAQSASAISLSARARRWSVEIERTVELGDTDGVRLYYRVTNHAQRQVPVLWAAHPQFLWRPGSRVQLPASVDTVLDVTSRPEPFETPWRAPLDRLPDHLEVGRGHKSWTLPGQRPSWARLLDADGASVTLSFDPDVLPYVGVWSDACAYAAQPTVAIEPSTGFYDDLSAAVKTGRVPWLAPREVLAWTVGVTLAPPDPERGAGHHALLPERR